MAFKYEINFITQDYIIAMKIVSVCIMDNGSTLNAPFVNMWTSSLRSDQSQLSHSSMKILLLGGVSHNQSLYIIVHCHGNKVPIFLVDYCFTLNVCHFWTVVRLGLSTSNLMPLSQSIRAHDNT